jgi:hypothetical protein
LRVKTRGKQPAKTLTGDKEEEAHNHSPMKNTQRKTTAHSHPGPK